MLLKYATEFKVPLKLPLNVLKWLFSSSDGSRKDLIIKFVHKNSNIKRNKIIEHNI